MARPLVKRTEEGDLYIRPHGIETKIDAALAQDWCSLTKRVRTNENTTPGGHAQTGIRVIADRKGIKQLKKINKGGRKQFLPKGFHA